MTKKDFIQDALTATNTKDAAKARESLKKQLVDLSTSNTYEKAVTEWTFDSYKYDKGKCACGSPIYHKYTMRNKLNGNRIVVGSTCVSKYFIGRDDLINIVRDIRDTRSAYERVLKKYGKLVSGQYVWTDKCNIEITEYDKTHKNYANAIDAATYGISDIWDIPDDFWRIIRILMSFDDKHEIFDAYETRFLNDILWQSYEFVHKTEKQQKFFLSIFTSKVMPILYDWYGPVKADN